MKIKRQIKSIKVHGKIKLAKVKPVKLIQNTNTRKVRNMRMTEERMEEIQPTDSRKAAEALMKLQKSFMNARIRNSLEVHKNEK